MSTMMRSTMIDAAPERMDHHIRMRLRMAAFRAARVYPGAVGELLSQELLTWETLGIRLGSKSMIMRVVEEILAAEIPDAVAA